ncbi:hypothetical protein BDW02DRAFT_272532 [Decorospora gaudefroyi]|uniref:Uncharacterized protein n=1 Tax=Decorospora gaudefroyi TaxID=184978 RepID=A0A6A5KU86_9PLEO|nr:hypothetical protein BDW02DRAFT_272532 [Decorospora gaudefroyi]
MDACMHGPWSFLKIWGRKTCGCLYRDIQLFFVQKERARENVVVWEGDVYVFVHICCIPFLKTPMYPFFSFAFFFIL